MKNTRENSEDFYSVRTKKGDSIGAEETQTISMTEDGNETLTFMFPNGNIIITFWELMAMQELWLQKQREDIIK